MPSKLFLSKIIPQLPSNWRIFCRMIHRWIARGKLSKNVSKKNKNLACKTAKGRKITRREVKPATNLKPEVKWSANQIRWRSRWIRFSSGTCWCTAGAKWPMSAAAAAGAERAALTSSSSCCSIRSWIRPWTAGCCRRIAGGDGASASCSAADSSRGSFESDNWHRWSSHSSGHAADAPPAGDAGGRSWISWATPVAGHCRTVGAWGATGEVLSHSS